MSKYVRLGDLRQWVDAPGDTLRRAVRTVGAETTKDDDGRIWVAKSDVKSVLKEIVRRGGQPVKKERG